MHRMVNLLLRGGGLVSKFIFVFFLARYLSEEELGLYSLYSSTIIYLLFFLGLDFYVFSNREIISVTKKEKKRIIFNQFVLYFFMLSVLLLGGGVFGFFTGGELIYFLLFFVVITEHLSQEITRVLIALGEPVKASFILFLRVALWTYVVICFFYFFHESQSLLVVIYFWLVGSFSSFVYGLYALKKDGLIVFDFGLFDCSWVVKGLKIALPFLLVTLLNRSVFVFDKYYLSWSIGDGIVGVYAVYFSLASALLYSVDALVFQYSYPSLVKVFKKRREEVVNEVLRFFTSSFFYIIVFSLVILLIYDVLFEYLGGGYIEYSANFPYVLLSVFFYTLSHVPHYVMYSGGYDKGVLIGSGAPVLVLFSVLVLFYLLGINIGFLQFLYLVCFIFFLMFVFKFFACLYFLYGWLYGR